jgi:hypothetical protein
MPVHLSLLPLWEKLLDENFYNTSYLEDWCPYNVHINRGPEPYHLRL